MACSPWDEADAGEPDAEPLSLEQPGLFACYDAAARGLSVSGERAGQPAHTSSGAPTAAWS
jgi:hypothetical protein